MDTSASIEARSIIMTQQEIFAQWPLLAVVAIVTTALSGFFWKIWAEWKTQQHEYLTYQAKQDERWQVFLKERDEVCRQWQAENEAKTQVWQLEIAKAIAKSTEKQTDDFQEVKQAVVRMSAIIESLSQFLLQPSNGMKSEREKRNL